MEHPSWTSRHDRLLREATPPVADISESSLDQTWDRVARETGASVPRRRRPGWRAAAAAVVGSAVIGTSSLAAAGVFTAHTGRYPDNPESLRLGGPGEYLDPAAPDYGGVVADITGDIPFPSDDARAVAVAAQAEGSADERPGESSVATGAVRAWVADAAVCAWSDQWAAATRSGDAAAREAAALTIQQAPSWSAVTDIDPKPYTHRFSERDKGKNGKPGQMWRYNDDSQFYYLGPLGQAVQGTNIGVVVDLLAENNGYCTGALITHIPWANPTVGQN